MEIRLGFKILHQLSKNRFSCLRNNRYVNVVNNSGLCNKFSIPKDLFINPFILSLNKAFVEIIKSQIYESLKIKITDYCLPFNIKLTETDNTIRTNVQIKLYPPDLLLISLNLDFINLHDMYKSMIDVQQLPKLIPLNDIVKIVIEMVEFKIFDISKPVSNKIIGYVPYSEISLGISEYEFENFFNDNENLLVGILVRNYNYQFMEPDVTDLMTKKNHNHNVKNNRQKLMIDNQGILFVYPDKKSIPVLENNMYNKAISLLELAKFFEYFLKNYSRLSQDYPKLSSYFISQINTWVNNSRSVFDSSSTRYMWELFISELGLKEKYNAFAFGKVEVDRSVIFSDDLYTFYNQLIES